MIEIIGVRFKANGKVYYFSPGDHQFQTGDLVVVETSKGTECGEVTIPNKTIQQAAVVQPLKQPRGRIAGHWNKIAKKKFVHSTSAKKKLRCGNSK